MALSHNEIVRLDRGPVKVFPAGGGQPMEVVPAGGTTYGGHRSITVSDSVVFNIEVEYHLEAPNGPHAVVDVDTLVHGKPVSSSRGRLDEGRSWELRGGSYILHEKA